MHICEVLITPHRCKNRNDQNLTSKYLKTMKRSDFIPGVKFKLKADEQYVYELIVHNPGLPSEFFAISARYVNNGFNSEEERVTVEVTATGFRAFRYVGWIRLASPLYKFSSLIKITP